MNLLELKIWKPLSEEIMNLSPTPFVMVTSYTENTRSINIVKFTPIVIVNSFTKHTRSRIIEATFRGNHKNIVYPSRIGIQNILCTKMWRPIIVLFLHKHCQIIHVGPTQGVHYQRAPCYLLFSFKHKMCTIYCILYFESFLLFDKYCVLYNVYRMK